jgi:hypothetical protein
MDISSRSAQQAAGRQPSPLARVYTACDVIDACAPTACQGSPVAAHYAEQALTHQRRALTYLDEITVRRPVSSPPDLRQELLTRALEEGLFACRLLLRAQQELRDHPGTALGLRRAQLRALVESLEQQLYSLAR